MASPEFIGGSATSRTTVLLCILVVATLVVWLDYDLKLNIQSHVHSLGVTAQSEISSSSALQNASRLNRSSAVNTASIDKLRRCAYPLVYNKPPKTGSTFIQQQITGWAKEVGRKSFECGGWPHVTAIRLQECVDEDADTRACGVLNCHVRLDDTVGSVLTARLPNHRIVTSTRYAPHRMISHYMQMRSFKKGTKINQSDLRDFLLNEYNPYEIVSWHSGKPLEVRHCPITPEEELNIMNDVSKYFVVIDLSLVDESNAILKHFGLFNLTSTTTRVNERGSSNIALSQELQNTIYNVSCYEQAMHNALLLRMASLYELATKKKCIEPGRLKSISSCLHYRQKENLKSTWMF